MADTTGTATAPSEEGGTPLERQGTGSYPPSPIDDDKDKKEAEASPPPRQQQEAEPAQTTTADSPQPQHQGSKKKEEGTSATTESTATRKHEDQHDDKHEDKPEKEEPSATKAASSQPAADSASSEGGATVYIDGIMEKFAVGRSTFSGNNWKTRYFSATREEGLKYYEKKRATKCSGTVPLIHASLICRVTSQLHPEAKYKHRDLLLIWTEKDDKERKLLLRCKDAADHDRWAKGLEELINPPPPPASKPRETPAPVKEEDEKVMPQQQQQQQEEPQPVETVTSQPEERQHTSTPQPDPEPQEAHQEEEVEEEEEEVLIVLSPQMQQLVDAADCRLIARFGVSLKDGDGFLCHNCGRGFPKSIFEAHLQDCEADLENALKVISLSPLTGLINFTSDPIPLVNRKGHPLQDWTLRQIENRNAVAAQEFLSHFVCCRGCGQKIPLHEFLDHSSGRPSAEGKLPCPRSVSYVENSPLRVRLGGPPPSHR